MIYMSVVACGFILSVLILFILIIFMVTPFLENNFQKYLTAGIIVFLLAMAFVPGEIFCNIPLPIINDTINGFVNTFLNETKLYQDIVAFDPTITGKITPMVAGIVKMCVVFTLLAAVLLITTLVLYIIHLCKSIKKNKKERKLLRVTSGFIFTMIMSMLILCIPVYSVLDLNRNLSLGLATEDAKLMEVHQEYKKYEKIFNVLDKGSEKLPSKNSFINKVVYTLTPLYSNNNYNELINELNSLNEVMEIIKKTGIGILYTDKEFDFTDTTKETFNYDEIKNLIAKVLDSKVYADMSRQYMNAILLEFENIITEDRGKEERLFLRLTEEKFRQEYKGIINMLKLVADYDLVKEAKKISKNMSWNEVKDVGVTLYNIAKDKGIIGGLDLIDEICTMPIVVKVKEYTGLDIVHAAVYTCVRIYSAMNAWLENYRQTDLYNTADTFLRIKGVI